MAKVHVAGLGTSDGVVFPVAEVGTYYGKSTKAEITETGNNSKHPQSPMLAVTFRLSGEGSNEALVSHYIVLPNAEYMTDVEMNRKVAEIKALQLAMGVASSDDELDTDALVNRDVMIAVNVTQYNGKDTNNIRNIAPVE